MRSAYSGCRGHHVAVIRRSAWRRHRGRTPPQPPGIAAPRWKMRGYSGGFLDLRQLPLAAIATASPSFVMDRRAASLWQALRRGGCGVGAGAGSAETGSCLCSFLAPIDGLRWRQLEFLHGGRPPWASSSASSSSASWLRSMFFVGLEVIGVIEVIWVIERVENRSGSPSSGTAPSGPPRYLPRVSVTVVEAESRLPTLEQSGIPSCRKRRGHRLGSSTTAAALDSEGTAGGSRHRSGGRVRRRPMPRGSGLWREQAHRRR